MGEVAQQGPLNPSSAHSAGQNARRLVLEARESVAALLGCDTEQVIFTSSGTEANNAALWHGAADGAVITSPVEHSSILAASERLSHQGVHVEFVAVGTDGRVTPKAVNDALDRALARGLVGMVSIQWANNETGVIQPIEQITEICHSRDVPIHVDAAQAVGKIPIDLSQVPIDFLTLTAHKFHGPTGVGALFVRDRVRGWQFGGDQEGGNRAGTENVIGIVGLGQAAEARRKKLPTVVNDLISLRDEFESRVQAKYPWVKINSGQCLRTANTSNLQFVGLDGQAILAQLDVASVCVSQSSACTNQRPTPSYVLKAIGLSEAEAFSSVRFSFGETNTQSEVDTALSHLFMIVDRLSALEKLA